MLTKFHCLDILLYTKTVGAQVVWLSITAHKHGIRKSCRWKSQWLSAAQRQGPSQQRACHHPQHKDERKQRSHIVEHLLNSTLWESNAAPIFQDPQMAKEFTTQPRSSAFIQMYPNVSISIQYHISDEVGWKKYEKIPSVTLEKSSQVVPCQSADKIVWFTKWRAQELWLQKAYLNATAFLPPPNATASPWCLIVANLA